jgi:Na+/melibiose symporter-like transporter
MLVGGFVQFVISQFYQKYATDRLLLDSAIVGSIFFVSRVTDAVLDPVCGYLSDKYNARRSVILLGLVALTAGMAMAFMPVMLPQQAGPRSYALAAGGIFTIYLGVTMIYIPHYAWLATLDRRLPHLPFFASRAVTENFGTILGGLALGILVPLQLKGEGAMLSTVLMMTVALALVGSVPLLAYRGNAEQHAPATGHSFMRSLRMLAVNRRFALVAAMSFFNQFAATTLLAVSLYYTDYVLGDKQLGVTLAIVFLLSATIFVPIWSLLTRRYDRYQLWALALVAILIVFPTLLITQTGALWYLSVFAVLVGGAAGAVILFVPQEVSRATQDAEHEGGLYFAAFTFVNKSAMACAPLVIGIALSLAHYQPAPAPATQLAKNTITFLFVGLPGIAFLLSLILLRIYRRSLAQPR